MTGLVGHVGWLHASSCVGVSCVPKSLELVHARSSMRGFAKKCLLEFLHGTSMSCHPVPNTVTTLFPVGTHFALEKRALEALSKNVCRTCCYEDA